MNTVDINSFLHILEFCDYKTFKNVKETNKQLLNMTQTYENIEEKQRVMSIYKNIIFYKTFKEYGIGPQVYDDPIGNNVLIFSSVLAYIKKHNIKINNILYLTLYDFFISKITYTTEYSFTNNATRYRSLIKIIQENTMPENEVYYKYLISRLMVSITILSNEHL